METNVSSGSWPIPGRCRGLTTVAEGVEAASRLAPVTAAGCSKVQGDRLGRPTHARAAITRLAARANDASGEKRDEHGADGSAAA
ncbi:MULTISPECIES: hypothetical protein [unclassified Methylobacterium]|uniref:hypothetical protein n=1 Tax=unclassified Methylobacterium TaxID=2615210 RepID=UPI0036F718A4